MAAGVGQVGGVGVEVLAATPAVVLGTEQDDVAGPPGEGIAQVVKGATDEPIAGGLATAVRAGPAAVVAALDANLGLGQIIRTSDADGGVGAIFAGAWHGVTPERKILSGNTSRNGKVFTDSARFSCYRLLKSGFISIRNS